MACAVPSVMAQDSRFQEVKSYYAKLNWSDASLADALIRCREHFGYDDDWFPTAPSQRSVFTRFLNNTLLKDKIAETTSTMEEDELVAMYNKLYSVFSPKELEYRLNMLTLQFGKVVDKLEAADTKGRSRQQLIKDYGDDKESGYVKIMRRVFRSIEKGNSDAETIYNRRIKRYQNPTDAEMQKERELAGMFAPKYQKIIANEDVLMALAAPRIGEAEGFAVNVRNFQVVAREQEEEVSDDVEEKEDDSADEEEGSKGDRYSDFRLTKILDSLSPRARKFLNTIKCVDEEGKTYGDDLGVTQYVGARQAMIVLKRVLVTSTPDTMIDDLIDYGKQYPWLNELVRMLREQPDMASLVYAAGKGAEALYVYSNFEKGKYETHIANTRSADLSVMREAGNNMMRGTILPTKSGNNYSLYRTDGTLISLEEFKKIEDEWDKFSNMLALDFGMFNMVEGEPRTKKTSKALLRNIRYAKEDGRDISFLLDYLDNPVEGVKLYFEKFPEYAEFIADHLRGIGFDVTAKDVITASAQMMTKKSYLFSDIGPASRITNKNKISAILFGINGVYGMAHTAIEDMTKKGAATGQYLYNFASRPLRMINIAMALAKYNEVEPRVVSENKSLSTYNHTNLLHQIVDALSNKAQMSDEEFEQMLEHDYLRYEGMSLGSGTARKVVGWLRFLRDSILDSAGYYKYMDAPDSDFGKGYDYTPEYIRDHFKLIDISAVNHVEYSKLSREQKLTNALVQFFNGRKTFHADGMALYEVPIQADYDTAYNFICAPIYGDQGHILDSLKKRKATAVQQLEDEYKRSLDDAIARGEFTADIFNNQSLWEDTYSMPLEKSISAPTKDSPARPYYDAWQERVKELNDKERKYLEEHSDDLDMIYEVDGELYASTIIEKLADEVLIELERIQSIERRKQRFDYLSLGTRDERGLKFQIFPEFNDNGFREKFAAIEDPIEAQNFLYRQIEEQLKKVVQRDIKTLEDSKVLANPAMKYVTPGGRLSDGNIFSEDGSFENLTDYGKGAIQNFSLNNFYARVQMVKIFNGGLENFNGLLDYEKRNMMLHATHTSLYTQATWNGRRVGKDNQNVMILEDDNSESAFISQIQEMLKVLLDNKVVSKQQYENMVSAYGKIKTTDGQGFRTLESYREVQVMAGNWDNAHETAYWNIIKGKPTQEDIALFMQNIKPVYTGFEIIEPTQEGDKPIRVTTLHKYSEQVLLPVALAKYCLQAQSTPIAAMAEAAEQLKKGGNPIDMFIFHSGVKVGAFGIADPFRKEGGVRVNKDSESIKNEIVEWSKMRGSIHTYPFSGYGMAASTPPHVSDDAIAWATQAETVAEANIEDGDTVTVRGEIRDAKSMRELRCDMRTADIIEMYKKIREIFTDSDELERVFQEELASKSYNSREMQFALTHLKDGTFAIPLFAPNVEHQVQQLLASIIKKRMTKPRLKGANILQATGLGMDVEVSNFAPTGSEQIFDRNKLQIVFEGKGREAHVKYVEVFMPLHDSRLKMFADENGNIGPERLQELVDNGTVPESMLEFIAYRTPSDAEHSVMPCRIKGFMANTGGATLIMPKEVMVMTGHDYDGDKMRCHFKNFSIVDRKGNEINLSDEEAVLAMLGQSRLDNSRMRKCVVDEYDYSKDVFDNNATQRANGRIELMFAQLTSPAGSRRMLIPGGCEDTKIMAKSIHLVQASNDGQAMQTIVRSMKEDLKMSDEQVRQATKNSESLYNAFIRLSDKKLSQLMAAVSGYETPFSVTHAADAFDYMMGGAEMIGIYAMYNAAFQKFQRLNLEYKVVDSKGKVHETTLLGHTFGKMFQVRNRTGRLASLSFARLLNAAVDNGKDPILGYLNQVPAAAELTFFLLANGMTEEDVHLIFSQPAVAELMHRLKSRDSMGFKVELMNLLSEMVVNEPGERKDNDLYTADNVAYLGNNMIKGMTREDFINGMATSYEDMMAARDTDEVKVHQAVILRFLQYINHDAGELAKFVKLMRPDSDKGSIGTSVSEIVAQLADIQNFRKGYSNIIGMKEALSSKAVSMYMDNRNLRNLLGAQLPEISALNALMVEDALDMFRPYFPLAKTDWASMAMKVANLYSVSKVKGNLVQKIANEMILWKLLSDKKFITGNPQEEQKRILVDVPKQFRDLMNRIEKAHKNIGTANEDPAADTLYGNLFLQKLVCTSPEEEKLPRLMFLLNGAPAEGTTDIIRAGWGTLIQSTDSSIHQLGIDLFKYNLYTSGFGYGMYEFAHFAPFSALMDTPGYIKALKGLMNTSWKDKAEQENFINQYYLNHWGDTNLLMKVNRNNLKLEKGADGTLVLSSKNKEEVKTAIGDQPYLVVASKTTSGKSQQDLYRVEKTAGDLVLVPVEKLGKVSRRKQVTLQYNPTVDYHYIKPVVPGNDSAWGILDDAELRTKKFLGDKVGEVSTDTSSSSYNAVLSAEESASRQPYTIFMNMTGKGLSRKQMQAAQEKTAGVVQSDSELDKIAKLSGNVDVKPKQQSTSSVQPAAPATTKTEQAVTEADYENLVPVSDAEISAAQEAGGKILNTDGGNFNFDPSFLTGAAIDTSAMLGSEYDDNGKFLNLVYRDKNGDYQTGKFPVTPNNVRQARKQSVFARLNQKLTAILEKHGVAVGTLYDAEALMAMGGIADFDTATVTAEGLLELIRIANGWEGEYALPEEFAHVALEMLGHDHPLVSRLFNAINSSNDALEEAYDGMYSEYAAQYGEDNREKLVIEAAGKLVAKHLFLQQQIQTSLIRRLISRISDAIKSFFRKFSVNEVQNAIFDANEIASKIAREMLGGKLADDMSLENIGSTGQFLKVQQNLTGKQDILSKLLKIENKRLAVFKKRLGYSNGKTSQSLQATEHQIKSLESAIKNYKTEEALVAYLNNSLTFLASTEKSLDDAVNSGRAMNSVCQKLNTVRDTLYSFATAIQDIREAIVDGEVTDTHGLSASVDQVSGMIAKFMDKYNSLARTYFEEMLSSVYGEHGKTVTTGRNKGRTISIHEMATKADRDISLASRWFNSLADCNDYVLKAIDDIVRDAKVRSRRRATDVRPRIETAIADLLRETGSRDQSFMFEYAIDKNTGKRVRTGKYITEEDSKKLSPAQKKFYDAMMKIKAEADSCIPASLVDDDHRKIVMLRKYTMDKYKDAEGAGGKALVAWEGLKNSVMDMSDDFDPENHEVAVDFQGNKVDMLPVKFVLKGKNESYDDMTDDVATSMMAYAGMAYEYNELNGVINILENAKYMAAERDVTQRTGSRMQRESIETDDAIYREPFTKKAARMNSQKALEDFFSMHLYGHLAANEGTIGKTRISKRKVVDAVNHLVSLSQMALNLSQRIANVSTGSVQVLVESAGKGVYNAKDVAWASAIYTKESGDRLAQTGKTDYDNKLSLWNEYFDVHQDNGRRTEKYKKGRMSRIFNENLLYAGLSIGEDYLSSVTSLAAARNFKVKSPSGKVETLWDAYEVRYHDAVNKTGAYLALKDGYTKEDGSPITAKDENAFAKQVIGLNFEMQGIYNLDDRSAVQQYAFGALIIMYRKWIAPAIKRRYGPAQYSTLKGSDEEGYYRTMFRTLYDSLVDAKDAVTEDKGAAALLNIVADVKAMSSALQMNWSKLNEYEKSNMRKAFTELGIVLGLFLSSSLLLRLPPDDHDGNEFLTWMDNLAMSQLLRLRAEIGAQAPTPMFIGEALRILKSPFAAIGPIKSTLNIFQLMLPHNYMMEIKSGKYKGHTKAYKYFREFPIISMFKKIDNFVDPSPLIQYYRNDAVVAL